MNYCCKRLLSIYRTSKHLKPTSIFRLNVYACILDLIQWWIKTSGFIYGSNCSKFQKAWHQSIQTLQRIEILISLRENEITDRAQRNIQLFHRLKTETLYWLEFTRFSFELMFQVVPLTNKLLRLLHSLMCGHQMLWYASAHFIFHNLFLVLLYDVDVENSHQFRFWSFQKTHIAQNWRIKQFEQFGISIKCHHEIK